MQDIGRQVEFSRSLPGTYTVILQYNGVCGWSNEIFKNIEIESCRVAENYLNFTPNPASGETTLSIETASEEKTFDETAQWELEVYLETQLLKTKQTNLRGQSAKIQIAGWKEGVYLVRVKYNDEILTGKLVVKR